MANTPEHGDDSHECDQCRESFITEQALLEHLERQHPAQDREVPEGTGGSRTDGGAGMVQTE